jgi:tetratricopeptide (TPR) repeat protein
VFAYLFSFGLGIVNYKKKKYERSLSFLNLAESLNQYNFNIICYKSIVLESLGNNESALEALQLDGIEMTPVLYFRKAKLYSLLHRFNVIVYFYFKISTLFFYFRKQNLFFLKQSENFLLIRLYFLAFPTYFIQMVKCPTPLNFSKRPMNLI